MDKKAYKKTKWICTVVAMLSLVLAAVLRETAASWAFFALAVVALLVNFLVLESLMRRHKRKMSKETGSAPVEVAKTKEERQEAARVQMNARIQQKPVKTGNAPKMLNEKQQKMQAEVARMAPMLMLYSRKNGDSHYLAVDRESGQPYEVKTRVIGKTGVSYGSVALQEFTTPPRKLTYEEFIAMADKKYPSISVLLEGISQENWREYCRLTEDWHGIPEKMKPITKDVLNPTRCCYLFTQTLFGYQDRVEQHGNSAKYLIPKFEEFLAAQGFVLCRIATGGGQNEISHLGVMAYYAEYTELADFCENFESDLHDAEKREHLSMDYDSIDLYMRRGELFFSAAVEEKTVRVNWYGVQPEDLYLIRSTNERLQQMMGAGVNYYRKVCLKHEFSPEFYKRFYAQWDIGGQE